VFAGFPSEPDRLHSHIVSDINMLCKAQHHFASVPITRITTELGRPEVPVGDPKSLRDSESATVQSLQIMGLDIYPSK
jgi:hypothetical protein